MKKPVNAKLIEGELATFWLDENGILCAIAKKVSQRTLAMQMSNYALIRTIIGNKKVCLLSDTTNAQQPSIEIRDYTEQELPLLFNAMGILSESAIGEIIPKAYLILNKSPVPTKFFHDVKEAKEWLKHYR